MILKLGYKIGQGLIIENVLLVIDCIKIGTIEPAPSYSIV